jgi:hypothetical protein
MNQTSSELFYERQSGRLFSLHTFIYSYQLLQVRTAQLMNFSLAMETDTRGRLRAQEDVVEFLSDSDTHCRDGRTSERDWRLRAGTPMEGNGREG